MLRTTFRTLEGCSKEILHTVPGSIMDIAMDYDNISGGSLDKYDDLSLSDTENDFTNQSKMYMQKFQNKVDFSIKSGRQNKDKSDRATTDHALDRRSLSILFKMMNQEIFTEVNGCISTGKEANVYHVVDSSGIDYALKVYMTSIMPFKSRDKYVRGDFRMRHGYSKATSWKLVSKWAEKEYRNLLRIKQSGLVLCPSPVRLKGVVLMMSFIGKDGIPAPKLKDAERMCSGGGDLEINWTQLYSQLINDVRTLYQKCRLIHADLSEYNVLYMDGKAWMIDVSQAVEHESPQALEYLRTDCHNVNMFFRKQGVSTLTLRELFEWVVNPSLPTPDDPNSAMYLEKLMSTAAERGIDSTVEIEDDAFRYVHIPRHLSAVYPFVRDFLKLQKGQLSPSDVYYAAVSGMKADLTGAQVFEEDNITENSLSDESENSEVDSGASEPEHKNHGEQEMETGSRPITNVRPKNETTESRKARKKLVKMEQAERRKTKIPKYLKHRRRK